MHKLLLIIGIPLVFAAGIFAYETGNLLWLGIAAPLAAIRFFMRQELKSTNDDIPEFLKRRPDQIESDKVSSHGGP